MSDLLPTLLPALVAGGAVVLGLLGVVFKIAQAQRPAKPPAPPAPTIEKVLDEQERAAHAQRHDQLAEDRRDIDAKATQPPAQRRQSNVDWMRSRGPK